MDFLELPESENDVIDVEDNEEQLSTPTQESSEQVSQL